MPESSRATKEAGASPSEAAPVAIDLSRNRLTLPLPLHPFVSLSETEEFYAALTKRLSHQFAGVSQEELKDTVSEAVFKMYAYYRKGNPVRNIAAFLHVVATRILLARFKQNARRKQMEASASQEITHSTPQPPETDIALLLERLTPAQREAIHLLFYEDMTEAAAADSLGVTRSAIAERKKAALARLRRLLRDDRPN